MLFLKTYDCIRRKNKLLKKFHTRCYFLFYINYVVLGYLLKKKRTPNIDSKYLSSTYDRLLYNLRKLQFKILTRFGKSQMKRVHPSKRKAQI